MKGMKKTMSTKARKSADQRRLWGVGREPVTKLATSQKKSSIEEKKAEKSCEASSASNYKGGSTK